MPRRSHPEGPDARATQSLGPAHEYLRDAWQRSILFLDVLRQRGNIYREQQAKTAPNVLEFDAELILDGRTLARPVNYGLVRIAPPQGREDRSGQAAVRRRRSARRARAGHRRHEAGQRDRRRAGERPSLLFHRLPSRADAGSDDRGRLERRSGVRPRSRAAPSGERQAGRHRATARPAGRR